jgi:hypothetical protein
MSYTDKHYEVAKDYLKTVISGEGVDEHIDDMLDAVSEYADAPAYHNIPAGKVKLLIEFAVMVERWEVFDSAKTNALKPFSKKFNR